MEYFVISAKFVPLKYYTLSSQLQHLASFSVGCSGRRILSPGQINIMRKWCIAEFILERKAFFIAFSHAHFCFWGHEHLPNRSKSKPYSKSDATQWVEKSSTSGAFHAPDTGFYWSSENALHECFIAKQWCLSLNENATAHRTALKKC